MFLWRLFQILIFTGVLFANVYWQWTPNGYVASLLGILASYFATVALSKFIDLTRLILKLLRNNRLQQGTGRRLS